MVSRPLAAALLALLLVTAGCLGTTATGQTVGTAETNRTIDVSATGTATAEPDLAVVALAVEARADSADAARAQVAEDVATMRDALRELGVPDDAVTTTSYFVGPEYDYREGGRELLDYRAYHAFSAEIDVDRAGEVIDAAVANGATQVNGVQFTLSDETRAELRRQALSSAMSSARDEADAIASAAGVAVGPLNSASTSNVAFPRPYAVAAEAGGGDGGRTVVEPGPVEVTASVEVSFEIR